MGTDFTGDKNSRKKPQGDDDPQLTLDPCHVMRYNRIDTKYNIIMKKQTNDKEVFRTCEILALLQPLVAIRSPYFEEDEVMAYTCAALQKRGLPARLITYTEEKVTHFTGKNVICRIKGHRAGKKVCFNGHLDTVHLCGDWTRNPWGQQEDDRYYGVGALDMTGGAVAQMLAMERFARNYGCNFAGELLATFVSDEEGPYGLGTNALIESGVMDGMDVSVCCEPNAAFAGASFPSVSLGARGGFGVSVEVRGAAAHASQPQKGINAVVDAAAVVREIEKIVCRSDDKLGRGVYCVLGIESEIGACSVPDFACIRMFRHTVRLEDRQTILTELNEAICRAGVQSRCQVVFRPAPSEGSACFMPYTVAEDDPYVLALCDCVDRVCGQTASITYFDSIGDFNYLGSRLGAAPAILFGPSGEKFHGSDEYVTLSSIADTAAVLYRFLERTLLT